MSFPPPHPFLPPHETSGWESQKRGEIAAITGRLFQGKSLSGSSRGRPFLALDAKEGYPAAEGNHDRRDCGV